MGGIVGGTILEVFKIVGIKAGTFLIGLVWALLLIGVVVLFYRTSNVFLKYFLVILIIGLLYVIDMSVANMPYLYTVEIKNITVISNLVIGFLILFKSVILSLIIYTGIIKN